MDTIGMHTTLDKLAVRMAGQISDPIQRRTAARTIEICREFVEENDRLPDAASDDLEESLLGLALLTFFARHPEPRPTFSIVR